MTGPRQHLCPVYRGMWLVLADDTGAMSTFLCTVSQLVLSWESAESQQTRGKQSEWPQEGPGDVSRSTGLGPLTTCDKGLFATTLQTTYPGQHNRLSGHPRHITTASKATSTFFHLNLKGTSYRLFSLTSVSWVLLTPFLHPQAHVKQCTDMYEWLVIYMMEVPRKSQTDLPVS